MGTLDRDDAENGRPIFVRGMWHEIASKSCRWTQTTLRDDGKTWNDNWRMWWTRA